MMIHIPDDQLNEAMLFRLKEMISDLEITLENRTLHWGPAFIHADMARDVVELTHLISSMNTVVSYLDGEV